MYELYYWPGLQGRGEFVRLALEDAGAEYVDVARRATDEGGGVPAMMRLLRSERAAVIPFAPPFLKAGDLIISQAANILFYLGPRLGLAPEEEGARMLANGLQLTIADVVAEAHDTHHPIASDLYYEDQKDAARLNASAFIRQRMPKYLGYFERILTRNPRGDGQIIGAAITYVDLSLFQLIEGLAYAFPRAMARFETHYPALARLRDAVAARPNIARYLASERRIAFNETGIFRRYPELDEDTA